MPRRLAVRLALALTGLAVVLVGGLAVLILATSAPPTLPPPLPTATAQPGPGATPLALASPLPTITAQPGPRSTPLALASPLPTVTPQPGPLTLPDHAGGLGADPNGAVRALVAGDAAAAVAAADLVYTDTAHPHAAVPPCGPHGRWSLTVDPENVVGYPYSNPPSAFDWDRAAGVIGQAMAVCPAPVTLSWFAHDRARPSSDRWTALLPPVRAFRIDGPALRRYALGHARQR